MFSIKIKKNAILFNTVSLLVIGSIGAISMIPNTANARKEARMDVPPGVLKGAAKRFNPIRCGKGMHPFSRWVVSPPSGLQRNAADIPGYLANGPRGFGQSTGVNKWFTQTYYTSRLMKRCCRIKLARVYVQGSHNTSPPIGALTGNIPANDVFAEFQNGSIMSMPSAGSFPAAPNSTWRMYPVNANNAMSGGKLSFAIGDDTNVLRTALNVQGCCLDPIVKPHGGLLRGKKAQLSNKRAQSLKKLMKLDKGARAVRGGKAVEATRGGREIQLRQNNR